MEISFLNAKNSRNDGVAKNGFGGRLFCYATANNLFISNYLE